MRFTGTVFTGLSEGAGYVRKYNAYFRHALGQEFFPGTLNLRTEEIIPLSGGIEVVPKEPALRPVHCYPVTVNGSVPCYIVVPTVRKHGELVVELLAQDNLRECFHLKDGDEVTCESA